jgi:hypothetical protein
LKLAQAAQAEALWGTKVRAEPERRFAWAWMTRKVEVPQMRALAPVQMRRKKAAKTQESLAERWRPEQALKPGTMEQAQVWMQSSKRKPELTESLKLK